MFRREFFRYEFEHLVGDVHGHEVSRGNLKLLRQDLADLNLGGVAQV